MTLIVQPVQFPEQCDTKPAVHYWGLRKSNLHVRNPDREGILAGGTHGATGIQDRVTAHRASESEKPQDRGKSAEVHDWNMQGHTET